VPQKRLPAAGKPVTPPRPTGGVVPIAPRPPTRVAWECPARSPPQWRAHLQGYQTSMDCTAPPWSRALRGGVFRSRSLVRSMRQTKVRELKAGGMGPTQIAKALKIGRASVYRVLEVSR